MKPDPAADCVRDDMLALRLRNALCWALGEGKRHRFDCICVLCEDARQLAQSDGGVGRG